jgi:hypothetical protein
VFRLFRPAIAALAVVGLIAAGCGGSSGTPTPPAISDPTEVLARSLEASQDITTFHLRVNINGKVNASTVLGGSAGLLGGNIDLSGMYIEGDVDATSKSEQGLKADLTFAIPSLLGLNGRIIAVDGYVYMKDSVHGDKYTKSPLGSDLPIDIPSALPSASGDFASQLADLQKSIKDAGITPTLKDDGKVDGKDCYHISLDVPADKLNELAGAAGDATAGMSVQSVTVDYYVYKDSLRPAKLAVSATVTGAGTLSAEIIITKYGESVSVKAPDASEIQDESAA